MDAEALVFVVDDDDASLRASLQDLLESGFVKLLTILPSP
jgi:FixJ family two-component response regulator